jgi:small-conductance mechanosensitive channel
MVRAHVTAGVVYGSPVEEVERLLMKAAREHKRVLRDPEPFVLFNDFGNSALLFDVYFWLSMTRIMERRIIESDIRFSIDGLFRKAGIVIAFPQLDVHFDENTPLQLKMMDSGKEGLKK